MALCRSYDEAVALLGDAGFKSSGIRLVYAMTGGGVKKVSIGGDGRLTWLAVSCVHTATAGIHRWRCGVSAHFLRLLVAWRLDIAAG